MPFSDYRTALVTGASSGIGAAVVERFRHEGIEVYALSRNAEALDALATRTGCIPRPLDVTDIDGITTLTREIPFDILVNNAGVDRPRRFLEATADDIDLLLDVNLRAVLHLCRLIVPGMVARDRGHVINISSIAGAYNFAGNSTYHATKAAISMLSRQLRDPALKVVRLTNEMGFGVRQTRVEYLPAFRETAERLAQHVGSGAPVEVAMDGHADVRLVIGHDLPFQRIAAR